MLRTLLSPIALCLLLAAAPVFAMQPAKPLPPDSEYVRVVDGHLNVGGQRQRYWAVIGKSYGNSYIDPSDSPEVRRQKVANARQTTKVLLDRFEALGFNAVRLWDAIPGPLDYTPGDGSPADDLDYFLTEARKRGFRIWLAGLNNAGAATESDVTVLSDPATEAEWKAAIKAQGGDKGVELRNHLARIWDPRLEAIGIRNVQAMATRVNHHTSLRWADDPIFAVWELSNEEWWIGKMLGGGWQQLPPFLRNSLVARWNSFLKAKYGTDDKLAAAWGGTAAHDATAARSGLLPGESLASSTGTVLFAPMRGQTSSASSINDASEVARAALRGLAQEYKREDFSEQRARDVLEFLVQLHVSHKQRAYAAIKPLGKSTRFAPVIFDTGIGYEIQSQFLHQSADAVAHDAYINGYYGTWGVANSEKEAAETKSPLTRAQKLLEADQLRANAGPWVNWLLKPPLIAQGVPWLEHNRVEGKPYLCYETQIMQPAKYRADFPLRIAALASIQDWDFVCWHYFGDGSLNNAGQEDRPFDRIMDVTTGGHPQGYHFTYDEVQSAMMRAAGLIWRQQLVPPAANPTRFTFGKKALTDPASMDYAGSYGRLGLDMIYTAWQYGVRLKIDPTRETDSVEGPVVSFDDRLKHNPYTPNPAVTIDWKLGHLIFDTPSAAAFTGLAAKLPTPNHIRLSAADVTLSDIKVHNAPAIYDAVSPDENYIAFALHTLDGRPLATSRRASMSLVSTSFNTGFHLGGLPGGPKDPSAGTLPVLHARVSATLTAPALAGMTYTYLDWHMKPLATGTLPPNGTLTLPADLPIFLIELTRP